MRDGGLADADRVRRDDRGRGRDDRLGLDRRPPRRPRRPLVQHLVLVAVAVAIGFVISFGLAIWAVRRRVGLRAGHRRRRDPVHDPQPRAVRAARADHRPVAADRDHPARPVHAADLVRNIVAGFDAVPPDVLEAADGMGYTGRAAARAGGDPARRAADVRRAAAGARVDDRAGDGRRRSSATVRRPRASSSPRAPDASSRPRTCSGPCRRWCWRRRGPRARRLERRATPWATARDARRPAEAAPVAS